MEDIADFEKWVGEMCSELIQQVGTARRLTLAFDESNMRLIQHGQIACLEVLKFTINKKVEELERMESAAQTGYTRGTLLDSGLTFIFGSLFMSAIGRKDSLEIGVQMAGSTLSRKVPFGTVLIGIGKEGIPEDVKVIPVSRLARESNRSESEVKTSLKHDGYLLMASEVFTQALNKTKSEILGGSLSLPIKISEITKRITH